MVGMEPKNTRVQTLEGAQAVALLGRMILHAADEGDRPVGRALVGPGAMAHRVRERVPDFQAAFVAERDRVPAARFQDDQLVRCFAIDEGTRSTRTALLLDRANDGETTVDAGGLPRDRRDGGGQRALGVDRAATKEALAVAPHWDEAGDRVHVP